MTSANEKKYRLLNDQIVKKLFSSGSEASQEYFLKIVSLTTHIPYEKLKKDFHFIDLNDCTHANILDGEPDLAFESDEYLISFLIHKGNSDTFDVKKISYIITLTLKKLTNGKEYFTSFYQVSLNNFDYFGKNDFLYRSEMFERESNKPRNLDMHVIDINLDYLRNLDCDHIKNADELEKLLYLFVCSDEKVLDELYEGNTMMDSIRKEVNQLVNDFNLKLYYDEKDIEALKNETTE